ncbi:protein NETWORKED 2A [Argentina anserina]|uniref:protein NETWORKED 2A n=1 Tax=Argentina anserina TaxID=57926 RepID=UPI00217665B6|nr:protein NETWORKED 2A [Potentilla anserina]
MLQRAASNAYSWWWASHIRTKQSKWLEQNLQDMEEKVQSTLKIIDDDGDSFAKRAEMYYRKRPELVLFVEESFRAYRALAERYDHLSRDLQSANRTIATVFPERVQYAMEDEDDETASQTSISSNDTNKAYSDVNKASIPKVPKGPDKSMSLLRKGAARRLPSSPKPAAGPPRSGLTKEEASEEIDNLHKDILALQTEKEFVKTLYERGYDRYWEFENEITAMQKRVSSLQDEFGIGTVIEDDEARTLMAATALKSCKESLTDLREKKDISEKKVRVEGKRVREACKKFENLKHDFRSKGANWSDADDEQESEISDLESISVDSERRDKKFYQAKMNDRLEALTMTELAEKIDGLVNNVVSLETAVTSQNALVHKLQSETDQLQANVRSLEEEKETLMESEETLKIRLKEMEEELTRVKKLNRTLETQNINLEVHFTEACSKLDHLSSKLNNVKHDVEEESALLFQELTALDNKPEELKDDSSVVLEDKVIDKEEISKSLTGEEEENKPDTRNSLDLAPPQEEGDTNLVESQELEQENEGGQPNWRQLFLKGLEDREKILLEEYTSILRDYKDARKKLSEAEKKHRDNLFDLAMEIRDLRSVIAAKDKEIRLLKQKQNSPDINPEDSPCSTVYKYPNNDVPSESPTQVGTSPYSIGPSLNVLKDTLADILGETNEKLEDSPGNLKVTAQKEEGKTSRKRHAVRSHSFSAIEGRLRTDIDELLEANLEFWLRFSTSVHQIQKFQTSIQDLQSELNKMKQHALHSDGKPIYRHLREIETELSLWMEHNAVLKEDLHSRYSSLSHIQDEISRLSNLSSEGELISKYQAAKFQGEILNMKQENQKVAEELKAGLNRVKGLKVEVEKTLAKLDEELGMSASSGTPKRSTSKARIPLRSFLFGVKVRRRPSLFSGQQSIFSCAGPSLQKQSSDVSETAEPPPQPQPQSPPEAM